MDEWTGCWEDFRGGVDDGVMEREADHGWLAG